MEVSDDFPIVCLSGYWKAERGLNRDHGIGRYGGLDWTALPASLVWLCRLNL